jgi:hypothetical protein
MKFKKLYTLLENKETQELHLFNSRKDEDDTCRVDSQSVCQSMHFSNKSDTPLFICESEENTRILCATKGRAVCERCISKLYKTEVVAHSNMELQG